MGNGPGFVMASDGGWIHPDSAASTQIDETAATGVTTVTITYGANTYRQTITVSTPSAGVTRTVLTNWVKQ
jgi:hypothetical protein